LKRQLIPPKENETIPSERLTNNRLERQGDIMKNHTILLAEDDLDDQEMLIEALHEKDPSVTFLLATTGSKALEILKKMPVSESPSLIVLDYNLPEVSGAEILARLRQMPRYDHVLKVVWSTSNSPVYRQKCMGLGVHSYIVKPTGIAGIRQIAEELLALCATP
jgi:CheY-like chemotaxis protein